MARLTSTQVLSGATLQASVMALQAANATRQPAPATASAGARIRSGPSMSAASATAASAHRPTWNRVSSGYCATPCANAAYSNATIRAQQSADAARLGRSTRSPGPVGTPGPRGAERESSAVATAPDASIPMLMPRRAFAALPAAVIVAVLALPSPVLAGNAFNEVFKNFERNGGAINPCTLSDATLKAALGEIPNDLQQYASDIERAIKQALSARARGACEKAAQAPPPATTTTTVTPAPPSSSQPPSTGAG